MVVGGVGTGGTAAAADRSYWTPGTILCALHILTHLIFNRALGHRYFHYLHFILQKTEAQAA